MTATPSTAVRIRADFAEDLRQDLQQLLAQAGSPVPPTADVHETCKAYFKALWHRIAPRPRTVVWSAELYGQTLPEWIRSALDRIAADSRLGSDLNPRLTKQRMRPQHNDGLLNDWGLHHMHLGPISTESDGSAGRTGELLFVYPTETTLYFVDVLDHESFACQRLIEIVHRNWPKLLEPYRMPDNLHLIKQGPFTDSERSKLRKAGVTMWTQVSDGTVYHPPGGGIAINKTSNEVMDSTLDLMQHAGNIAEWCNVNAATLMTHVQKAAGKTIVELYLKLRFAEGGFAIEETQTGISIKVNLV